MNSQKHKISKIIFIGGNRYNEDGPLIGFALECLKQNINCILLVDPHRINYPTKTMGTFKDALEANKIKYQVIDSITEDIIDKYKSNDTIIFSAHCRWIIPKNIIEKMSNKIYNYHNLSLPSQRGAAGHSWRLMQGIKESELNIHYVTPAIDKGNIVLKKNIKFPKSCNSLEKSYAYIEKHEQMLFQDFLSKKSKLNKKQKDSKSFYWPRLDSSKNGYIDWTWSAKHIMQFCSAFDKPFDGASTFINSIRVFINNARVTDNSTYFHPYQAGLIYRIDGDDLFVATVKGGLKIKINKTKSHDVKIKLGDRFITPLDILYSAKIEKNSY